MTNYTPTRTLRIAIVDDHELLRDGLRTMLAGEPDLSICGEAVDLEQGRVLILETQPDIAVIDIAMPSGSGLDLVQFLHAKAPSVRVIVMTMYTEHVFGPRAWRAGAAGFVCKQEPARTILDALRCVSRGERYFSPALLRSMTANTRADAAGSPVEALSNRELEIFRRIGQGLGTAQIAGELGLSRSTIETYRERLKTKLGLAGGAELVRQAVLWETKGRGTD